MKTKTILPFILLILVFFTSCTKTEVYYFPVSTRTLVLVTDVDPSSDLIVGIKGRVKTYFPEVQIEFYKAPDFDIFEGSYLLDLANQNYPPGTYIAGLIKPGNTGKSIIYEANSKIFISPDNTLSTRVLYNNPDIVCYYIENSLILDGAQPKDLSFEEFFTRSILSMLSGASLSSFGSVCTEPQLFEIQPAIMLGDTLKGEVLYVDSFGNCITNIPEDLVANFETGALLNMTANTTELTIKLGTTYSSVPVGEAVCFVNNSKRLEIAINYGNFSETYQTTANSKIAIFQP